jgi:hypothetical protein
MPIVRYFQDPSKRTPWIILEPGRILIMGRSIPDNPLGFYLPVHNWIKEYILTYKGSTQIDLGFEYINTTSTKWIFLMLKDLCNGDSYREKVNVNWFYEEGDEDMKELGYILRSLVTCPFDIIEVEEMNPAWFSKCLTPVT